MTIIIIIHSYVPTVRTVHNVDITKSADSSETVSVQADFFHNIFLGGNQLTCAWVSGSQRIRETRQMAVHVMME